MPRLCWVRDSTFSSTQPARSFLFRLRFSNLIQAGICGHSTHSPRSANLGSCAATPPSSAASARGYPNELFWGLQIHDEARRRGVVHTHAFQTEPPSCGSANTEERDPRCLGKWIQEGTMAPVTNSE